MNVGLRWEPYRRSSRKTQFSHFDTDQWAGVHSTVFKNAPAGVIFSGDPGYPGKAAGRRDSWTSRRARPRHGT